MLIREEYVVYTRVLGLFASEKEILVTAGDPDGIGVRIPLDVGSGFCHRPLHIYPFLKSRLPRHQEWPRCRLLHLPRHRQLQASGVVAVSERQIVGIAIQDSISRYQNRMVQADRKRRSLILADGADQREPVGPRIPPPPFHQ